ncbi:hypothetical protein [Serinicoccus chungangensis]|uniref:hypothetical protein n=1 Tax=Serinicoccus chungangensis TaxID=767452 RepID=UPI001119924A|nr:hypothetical protein [Serinicoccus chungangensis]
MRLFVAIRTKNTVPLADRSVLRQRVGNANVALDRVQPWPAVNTTQDLRWVPGGGRVAMLFRSNEPTTSPERLGWMGNKNRAWAWSGIVGSHLLGALGATSAESLPPETAWSGMGSFGLVGASASTLVGITNQHRSEGLYWTETEDVVILSNSAAVLSLIRHGQHPVYSRLGIAGFLMHGLPFAESLPFAGVAVVPAAAQFCSDPRSDFRIIQDEPDIRSEDDLSGVAEQIAEGLVDYARVLTRGAGDVVAAITGGKDSRLVVAALHAAGVDFSTYTNGLPESGEGVVGREVTAALGVSHRLVNPPVQRGASGGAVVVGRPEEQAWATLRSTGGMGNAFTALPMPSTLHVPITDRANLGGQGGEIVRGGFARYLNDEVPRTDRAVAILRKTWFNNEDVLTPLAVEAVEADVRSVWSGAIEDPARALFDGYVSHRTGRWLATMRHGESVVNSHTTLLINNQMVRALRSLPSSALLGEQMAHAVMTNLAPQVVDLPFFRDRWAFETEGPLPSYKPATWENRAPYTAHDQPRASFNWRSAFTPGLSEFFLEYLMSSPQSMIFDVVDREAVAAMLRGRRYRAPLAWALFSAQYMLSGDWLGDRPSDVKSIEIAVPS